MLDLNFTLYSTITNSTIEIRNREIYAWFPDINARDVARLLSYFDLYNVPVSNYNKDELKRSNYWKKNMEL